MIINFLFNITITLLLEEQMRINKDKNAISASSWYLQQGLLIARIRSKQYNIIFSISLSSLLFSLQCITVFICRLFFHHLVI